MSDELDNSGVEAAGKGSTIVLRVQPETFRFLGYCSFWFTMICSIIVTNFISFDKDETALVKTFGYNNICLFFDFDPARIVASILHSNTEVLLTVYFLCNGLNFFRAYSFGLVSYHKCKIVVFALVPLQTVGLLWFRTSFVVLSEKNMTGHTMPFLLLQASLASISLQNYWFRQAVCPCSQQHWKLHLAYVAMTLGCTMVKVVINIFALSGSRITSGQVAQFFDVTWMVLVAGIPLGLAYCWRQDAPPESLISISIGTRGQAEVPFIETIDRISQRARNLGFTRRAKSAARLFVTGLAIYFVLTNFIKVPFYLLKNQPATNTTPGVPAFGMESTITLRWMGYRSKKIAADPVLFLAPHTIMACTLLGMWVLVLLGKDEMKRLSPVFFAVASAFAIHILPVRGGVPNRELDMPINEILVAIILTASAVGAYGYKYVSNDVSFSKKILATSWAAIIFALILTPLAEAKTYTTNIIGRLRTGEWPVPEGDLPDPMSGHNAYALCGCAVFGRVVVGLMLAAVLAGVTYMWRTRQSPLAAQAAARMGQELDEHDSNLNEA